MFIHGSGVVSSGKHACGALSLLAYWDDMSLKTLLERIQMHDDNGGGRNSEQMEYSWDLSECQDCGLMIFNLNGNQCPECGGKMVVKENFSNE